MNDHFPALTSTASNHNPPPRAAATWLGFVPRAVLMARPLSYTARAIVAVATLVALPLICAAAVMLATTAHAQTDPTPTPSWSFGSGQATGWGGDGMAIVGDVNDDGFDDVIVGAPSYDVTVGATTYVGAGKVWLFYGSASGLSQTPAWTFDGPTNNTNSGAGMGASGTIAAAGDINNDGFADVIIGCPGYDIGAASTNDGAVFVFFGSASGLAATPNQTLIGLAGSRFGASVAGRGKFNNDAYADIAVGGYSHNGGAGASSGGVWTFIGGPTGLNTTVFWEAIGDQASSQFSRGLALVDVNNDTYTEVIAGGQLYEPVGGQSNCGGVFLWTAGPTGINGGIPGTSANAAWACYGNATNQYLGWNIADAGDVNNDGFRDVAIGAYGWSNGQNREGAIMVWHGSALGLNGGVAGSPANAAFIGESDEVDCYLGWSVAGLGDIDNDGYDDLIVGGYGYKGPLSVNFLGMAMVWRGGPNGVNGGVAGNQSSAHKLYVGPAGGSYFGWSVAGMGDVNDDGYDDVMVGANRAVGVTQIATEGYAYLWLSFPPVVVELQNAQATVAESVGTVTLTVTVSPVQTAHAVTVQYTTVNGAATAGQDFVAASGTLTIPANQASGSIIITIIDDALNETSESFTVVLSAPTGAGVVLGQATTATITITDNDPPPSVSLFASTQSWPESAGPVPVTVELSAASGQPVSVTLTFTSVTAIENTHWTATSGTVNFAPGDTFKVVYLSILDDQVQNPDRTLTASLSGLVNCSPGQHQSIAITLTDDDTPTTQAPSFTSTPLTTVALGATYNYAITVTAMPGATISTVGLPSWLSLVGGTPPAGTGVLTTTANLVGVPPPSATLAPISITLFASNGVGAPVTQAFTLTVASPIAGIEDVNLDGVVDVVDVQLTVNIILTLFQPAFTKQGDANADGTVDVVDVQSVVNRILFGSGS